MTLEQFIDNQKQLLNEFKAQWLANQAKEGVDLYPSELESYAEWQEHLNQFLESK